MRECGVIFSFSLVPNLQAITYNPLRKINGMFIKNSLFVKDSCQYLGLRCELMVHKKLSLLVTSWDVLCNLH